MRKHVEIFAGRLAITHRQLLDAAEACTDDDLSWHAGPTSPPIAFHLWHTGRWADRWAETVGGAPQRWVREGLTAKWGFPAAQGQGDTGMLLPDDEAAALPFPRRDQLTTYLRGAFNDLEQAVGALDDETILVLGDDLLAKRAPLADSLTRHLAHVNRHLGMVEALRGLRGGHGTATV
ncbi:MAG: DinB family protein [Chloroflexota bacterium]|nr:DinB family protein [Chloroflexota bacterium]